MRHLGKKHEVEHDMQCLVSLRQQSLTVYIKRASNTNTCINTLDILGLLTSLPYPLAGHLN